MAQPAARPLSPGEASQQFSIALAHEVFRNAPQGNKIECKELPGAEFPVARPGVKLPPPPSKKVAILIPPPDKKALKAGGPYEFEVLDYAKWFLTHFAAAQYAPALRRCHDPRLSCATWLHSFPPPLLPISSPCTASCPLPPAPVPWCPPLPSTPGSQAQHLVPVWWRLILIPSSAAPAIAGYTMMMQKNNVHHALMEKAWSAGCNALLGLSFLKAEHDGVFSYQGFATPCVLDLSSAFHAKP
eukprot:gene3580-4022_t